MKDIVYLLHWNEGAKSGVFQKVKQQVMAWRDQGDRVSVHVISAGNQDADWRQHLPEIPVFFYRYYGISSRLKAWRKAIEQIIRQSPDLVYFRYDLYMPGMERLMRQSLVVVEINTDDVREFCLGLTPRCYYNRLTRSKILGKAAGMVFVTHELAESPHFASFAKPHCVIANGVRLDSISQLPPSLSDHPRLVFMGTEGQPWHGVDKVLWLAAQLPEWRFDLIGIHTVTAPANVFLHGVLSENDYRRILSQADVAIGTLALHRIGMHEACPLKTRAYLASGLPVIIGYRDTDFLDGAPFLLQLPNTETNVSSHLDEIKAFVAAWRGKRVQRADIQHLDVSVKEAQRLAFFERIMRAA